jgi:outer membrane protein assembly factor BamE (lipoprotein component of BamABCDE complex)
VKERNLTVGTVQKEIRKGMDQGAVAEVLGAPNIVSSDKEGKETWIYDKISSEVSYSRKQGYLTLILFGRSSSELAASSAQKTLTIVIKFDDQSLVDTFSYHTSKF